MPYTFLPDTSVIYNKKILELIENGTLDKYIPRKGTDLLQTEKLTIVLSHVSLAEIESQANRTKGQESVGLEVLQDLYRLWISQRIDLIHIGVRPTLEQIHLNPGGELDAMIRKDALTARSVLVTADEVQSAIALVEGIEVFFVMNLPEIAEDLHHELADAQIHEFFDDTTMSIHLRAHCLPMAKKGRPGDWKLVPISDNEMDPITIAEIANRLMRQAKNDERSFIERNEPGVTVIQLRKYRIVICRPPFSNFYEITAVKPLVSLTLEDYNLPRKVEDRLDVAEGILVAGAPGAGKSTFISALTGLYLEKNKLVKTLESVRDLDVPAEVSQYAPLDGNLEKTADILLLIRPDFTIFDEVRTAADFKIFADLRLAGVGLVGVVHASKPVDAIQRFINRVELGVIPNVIDTVIFIDHGEVTAVLSLELTVKKPTGFTDRDLARPVIEVSDFLNHDLLYEIYAFGSDVIVAPVGNTRYLPRSFKAGMKTQHELESENEDELDMETASTRTPGDLYVTSVYRRSKAFIISVAPAFRNKMMNFYAGKNVLFSATLNKYGEVSIKVKSPVYNKIQKALRNGIRIEASFT